MKLYIKYMVSIRCKMIVKEVLTKIALNFNSVNLGTIDVIDEITEEKRQLLKDELLFYGLELIDNKKAILIEKIKIVVVEMVHYSDEIPKTKFSIYLSEKLNYNYTYLANLFSETKGITIEHFIVLHKVERIKELIIYDELTLTEIARKLHYSSVAHLSNQFKKITGLTPSYFRLLKDRKRDSLENL